MLDLNTYFTRFLLFISLFVFTAIETVNAQNVPQTNSKAISFTIRGSVADSADKQPLDFVTVILTKEKGEPVVTNTAEDGSFTLKVAEKGNYTLSMSYMGYKNYTSAPIAVTGDSVIDLGIILLEQEATVLDGVTITSRKSLIQNKGDKIVYNASADISNKAGSASDVLRKAPMVTVGADGEVKMRGSSNIKVLLNGLPSGIIAKNLKEALKMIPASTIESIEVITTPSAKYEAEGAAGVINIITKKKLKGTSGNIDLTGGNLEQSASGSLNIASGKFNFSLSLNANRERQRTLSELNRVSLSESQQTGTLLQRTDALQKNRGAYGEFTTEYRPDSLQKIGATVAYWYGSWPVESKLYNLYNSNQGSSEYNQQSIQDGKYHWADLSLNYQKKFRRTGQELQLVGQFSRSDDNANYQTDQYYLSGAHYFRERSPNKGHSNEMSFQADYVQPLNKSGKNLVETGARYARTSSASAYSVFNNLSNPGGELIEDPSRSDVMDYFQNIFAAYVSVKLETKGNWSFRPGLRYEKTDLGGDFEGAVPSFKASFSNFVPSMLISKKLNDNHQVKLNYTERIRRPWIWDLNPYVNASDPRNLTFGNPELRPEITRMLEAGHAYNGASGFTLNSSVFFNSNSNAIESLTTVDSLGISRTTSRNIAANKRIGANVNAYMQLNSDWILSAGGEFYHVRFQSKALNVENNANFYSVNINSSYTLPADYTVQVSADYSNGYVTLQGRNSANYTYRFSARKEFLNKKASVMLGINNPFQKTFLQRSYATAPSFNSNTTNRHYNRSFTVSFSWQFGSMRPAQEKGFDDKGSGGQSPRGGRKM